MCNYWDSGWCYAPKEVETTDDNGQCINPLDCKENIIDIKDITDDR